MPVVHVIIQINETSIKLWIGRILGNIKEIYFKKLKENNISNTIIKIVYSL